MRNMATFGMMDENRHGQLQLYFPTATARRTASSTGRTRPTTQRVGRIAARHTFDDLFLARSATDIAVMLTFAFETGFTNMQFLGLAADAAEAGDFTFSSLISSIQTDESATPRSAARRSGADRQRPQGRGAEAGRRGHRPRLAALLRC